MRGGTKSRFLLNFAYDPAKQEVLFFLFCFDRCICRKTVSRMNSIKGRFHPAEIIKLSEKNKRRMVNCEKWNIFNQVFHEWPHDTGITVDAQMRIAMDVGFASEGILE